MESKTHMGCKLVLYFITVVNCM